MPDSETVADAIRQFFRAHRALRTYPADNAIRQNVNGHVKVHKSGRLS